MKPRLRKPVKLWLRHNSDKSYSKRAFHHESNAVRLGFTLHHHFGYDAYVTCDGSILWDGSCDVGREHDRCQQCQAMERLAGVGGR